MLGVKHEFPKAFSTELTEGQVKMLSLLGVKTERVKLYHISGKPTCDIFYAYLMPKDWLHEDVKNVVKVLKEKKLTLSTNLVIIMNNLNYYSNFSVFLQKLFQIF